MAIELTNEIINRFTSHAEEDYPHECCGFLLGRFNGDSSEVTEYKPCINTKEENRERRFLIDPAEYQKAEDYADDNDLSIVGIFHSHPDHPNEPSEFDRVHAWPGFSYIIISIRQGKGAGFRSWLLLEDRSGFNEEQVIPELSDSYGE